jgi:hypothetical protein
MTTKRQKLIELAKKLNEMALKGEPNERLVAKKKLNEISKKYNINFDKITTSVNCKKRVFKLKSYSDEKDILVHSILDTNPDVKLFGNEQLRQIYATLSDEEFKNVKEKFSFYWNEYLKERDALLAAFILKNDIGIVASKNDEEMDKDVTAIINYMDNLSPKKFNQKKLTD